MAIFKIFNKNNDQLGGVKYGDLFRWVGFNNNEICIYTYDCLVSLENPGRTWWRKDNVYKNLIENLEEGALKKLESGTKITLTQE